MDEKFALLFQCHFKLADDFVFHIWTLSLPVVVIVHGNQEPHAWATVTWDNAFAAPGRTPYQVPEKVVWHRVGEVLSMKFRQYVGRPLTQDALRFLAGKAFRMPTYPDDYNNLILSWTQFAKEPLPDRSFTFWEWFYALLKVTREYLRPLWQEHTMIGFISRKQTEDVLLACQQGTFLLRFSDSELGGVTIAWVGESTQEVGPEVFMVQPFTSKDFAIRGLADRINDLKNLHFLYPNIPKDQVFGKFYSRVCEQPPLANGYVKPWLALTLPG
jgi:signal transducer and activator of transcription 5B